MGGKKKGGGGKKKKGGDDDGIPSDELYEILKAKVDSLKSRIYLEQERRDNAYSTIEYIRSREGDLDKDISDHKKETHKQVETMKTIYKKMESEKNEEIEECFQEVQQQEQQKRELQKEIQKL